MYLFAVLWNLLHSMKLRLLMTDLGDTNWMSKSMTIDAHLHDIRRGFEGCSYLQSISIFPRHSSMCIAHGLELRQRCQSTSSQSTFQIANVWSIQRDYHGQMRWMSALVRISLLLYTRAMCFSPILSKSCQYTVFSVDSGSTLFFNSQFSKTLRWQSFHQCWLPTRCKDGKRTLSFLTPYPQ